MGFFIFNRNTKNSNATDTPNPSATLQAFGFVSGIAEGLFIRFEKEKNKTGEYPLKNNPKTTPLN